MLYDATYFLCVLLFMLCFLEAGTNVKMQKSKVESRLNKLKISWN